ncbi:long-chain fatty acid transport protein 2-like [Neoarius graeffei]|uniref:long-chain fatty acid transport protein 2-like n=1 Tax=Neoarius graeffei TaxID=443677 RepID=UPI00298BEEFC|nr:long-chain fatty acid transport protein 2-like [Neoarius graeffei]
MASRVFGVINGLLVLSVVLGEGVLTSTPELDCAHRTLKHGTGGRPRSVVICFHKYQTGDLVIRESRILRGKLQYRGTPIQIFEDYSPDVLEMWSEYRDVMKELYSLGLKPSLQYPARLFVTLVGTEYRSAVCEVLLELHERGVCVFLLCDNCDMDGLQSLKDKIDNSDDGPVSHTLRANVTMRSPAVYIYTSGTTGLPKVGVILHDRIWAGTFFLSLFGVKHDDVIYIPLPLYHASGLIIGLNGAIERGITVVLKRKFSVSQFWDDCRKYNVTVIQYIGEVMRYLCNTPKKETDWQHKVRMAIGNGLRADVWQEFQHRFGVKNIKEFYAASDGNMGFFNYVGKVSAVGKVNFLQKKLSPHSLIQYDPEVQGPVRDSRGRCVPVPTGETGLLVCKITEITPFAGYAGNPEQTEKKKLRNVFEDGDVYLNSGDLMRMDHHGFVYFQDRVGDTFRWKGENVATTEVADIISVLDFVEDVSVYGVEVPGHEVRVGMAALTIKEQQEFDCKKAFNHVTNFLPAYAQPRFIRILRSMELTGTFKQVKMSLMKDGFDPGKMSLPIYFLQESSKSYVALTHMHYNAIISGEIRI